MPINVEFDKERIVRILLSVTGIPLLLFAVILTLFGGTLAEKLHLIITLNEVNLRLITIFATLLYSLFLYLAHFNLKRNR